LTDPGRLLYAQDVVRRVLALREDLVRHDENLAAHTLLTECVPYFAREHPAIVKAREEQTQMVLHVLEPDAYQEYYATNAHERPFEQQYGVSIEEAHRLPRLAYLRECLAAQVDLARNSAVDLRVLDLSANDGFMAANLSLLGYRTDCIDLHPGNCELAEKRRAKYPGIGKVVCGDLHDADRHFEEGGYPAVAIFETIEHVADPLHSLWVAERMVADGGYLYVSTPLEAVEQGNLPNWDHVEPKGHVRVFRKSDFRSLLSQYGTIERFEIGWDGVMFAQVKPTG
jgi:2-polyprenyl-3-methyl-5-hydroxy-6-metoxy-1,4-benzoquinol methylase